MLDVVVCNTGLSNTEPLGRLYPNKSETASETTSSGVTSNPLIAVEGLLPTLSVAKA